MSNVKHMCDKKHIYMSNVSDMSNMKGLQISVMTFERPKTV